MAEYTTNDDLPSEEVLAHARALLPLYLPFKPDDDDPVLERTWAGLVVAWGTLAVAAFLRFVGFKSAARRWAMRARR